MKDADRRRIAVVRAQVFDWVRETEALLTACRLLVVWYGEQSDVSSFAEAFSPSQKLLKSMVRFMASDLRTEVSPQSSPARFRCSSEVAPKISPLLQVLATPVPRFLETARVELESDQAKHLLRGFALFCGSMSDNVYEPFWKAYPYLAPQGWPL